MTKIVNGYPPNYAAILKKFPGASGPNVIFAYAPDIYVGKGSTRLPLHLLRHEGTHVIRQIDGGGPELWWEKYLADDRFCYEEELLAHRAEYLSLVSENANRNQRRAALKVVSNKLAASLYGNLVTPAQAAKDILNETV